MVGSIPACAGEPALRMLWLPSPAVYPRVCGGTDDTALDRIAHPGLSPRVRGNLARHRTPSQREGSIPACAGEPASESPPASPRMVYPRVCGGTRAAAIPACRPGGLSPRVRGNRTHLPTPRSVARSIPACAGEPWLTDSGGWPCTVYPRVCGGTAVFIPRRPERQGLSPRVRGNHSAASVILATMRSIPACAGEPVTAARREMRSGVYPRVCGGTSEPSCNHDIGRGLSPRVRGNRAGALAGRDRIGSIPACAGEPPLRSAAGSRPQVYPRVCGGTASTVSNDCAGIGLSPRVRGNPTLAGLLAVWRGSIPACAGEPSGDAEGGCSVPVYPRVCGGTANPWVNRSAQGGLSPRVRGNRRNIIGIPR